MEGVWIGAEAYSQKARHEHVPLYLMLCGPGTLPLNDTSSSICSQEGRACLLLFLLVPNDVACLI